MLRKESPGDGIPLKGRKSGGRAPEKKQRCQGLARLGVSVGQFQIHFLAVDGVWDRVGDGMGPRNVDSGEDMSWRCGIAAIDCGGGGFRTQQAC